MKKLSVPTMLAVMVVMSQGATAAPVGQWTNRSGLLTAADREDVTEVDHNTEYTDGTTDAEMDVALPQGDVPVPPAPMVNSPVVKKAESSAEVPAPKTKAKQAPVAREIPLIETQNAVESSPDVTYVTGGIGEEEKNSIEAAKADYNVHVMSASINGAFVGDARVVIRAKIGTETKEMLNVVAGPLLYVKLPEGKYVLDATLGEQKKHQDFTVAKTGATPKIHLAWNVAAVRSQE